MEESKDPCKDITCKVDSQMLRKDVLSPEEVQKLMACHYDNENPTVRQAFIFCLYCGLRFCNVKDLTFKNVDYANRLLKFEQSKAKEHSASSGVVIPLNDGLLSIIGEAPTDKNCLIFDLSIPALFTQRFTDLQQLSYVDKSNIKQFFRRRPPTDE